VCVFYLFIYLLLVAEHIKSGTNLGAKLQEAWPSTKNPRAGRVMERPGAVDPQFVFFLGLRRRGYALEYARNPSGSPALTIVDRLVNRVEVYRLDGVDVQTSPQRPSLCENQRISSVPPIIWQPSFVPFCGASWVLFRSWPEKRQNSIGCPPSTTRLFCPWIYAVVFWAFNAKSSQALRSVVQHKMSFPFFARGIWHGRAVAVCGCHHFVQWYFVSTEDTEIARVVPTLCGVCVFFSGIRLERSFTREAGMHARAFSRRIGFPQVKCWWGCSSSLGWLLSKPAATHPFYMVRRTLGVLSFCFCRIRYKVHGPATYVFHPHTFLSLPSWPASLSCVLGAAKDDQVGGEGVPHEDLQPSCQKGGMLLGRRSANNVDTWCPWVVGLGVRYIAGLIHMYRY